MDKIILPQINITACHGVYDEEKLHPQPFCIAVELYTDISSAVQSDNVADTVDYSVLFKKIKTLAESESFNLIEALAGAVANLVLEQTPAYQVKVRVDKLQAKAGDLCFPAAVEIVRSRI